MARVIDKPGMYRNRKGDKQFISFVDEHGNAFGHTGGNPGFPAIWSVYGKCRVSLSNTRINEYFDITGPWVEPEPPLKVVLWGLYETRCGEKAWIESICPSEINVIPITAAYTGARKCYLTKNGRREAPDKKHPDDLVKFIEQVPPPGFDEAVATFLF